MNNMDCHSEVSRNSRDLEVPEALYGQSLCRKRQSTKLGDRFRLDGHKLSYADFRSEIVNNLNNGPENSKDFQQKRQVQRKSDEVIRYMSNLPSYLERGERKKDITFNVGVLEWRRLEKWQKHQRQVPYKSCRSSPSNSNTSSFSSTEGSSSYSSRGHSCSPAHQMPQQTMIDSNLTASPSKIYSRAIKTSEKNGLKSHDLVDIPTNYLKLQQSILKTHQCFSKYTENKPKECKSNGLDLHGAPDKRRLQGPENLYAASSLKGKLKVQDGEGFGQKENLEGPVNDHADMPSTHREQTVLILLPKDGKEVSRPAYSKRSESAAKCDREAIETSRYSFVYESNCKVTELSPGITRCFCEADPVSQHQTEQPGSSAKKSIKFPSELSHSVPDAGRLSVSPARSKNLEERKPCRKLDSPAEVPKLRMDCEESHHKVNRLPSDKTCSFPRSSEDDAVTQAKNQADRPSFLEANNIELPPEVISMPYSGRSSPSPVRGKNLEEKKSAKKLNSSAELPDQRMDIEQESKSRHSSPIRRLSFSRTGRNSISKDSSMTPSLRPTNEIGSQGSETSALSGDSSCDKSNPTSKGRSSPLRRLLDPLLKPRAGNPENSGDAKRRAYAQLDRSCKLPGGRGEASALHSVKVKLDLGSCKSINIDHPQDLGKCGSTMVQALLQVAVKNGLPLFTFAVDKSSDIVAATVKKLSSGRKDGNSLIYTFFAIHEMKKKNGNWLSQGSKEKNHDYISDIVGQMKVSDVPNTALARLNYSDQCNIREFLLLAANTRLADQQTSDVQANNELAAIVVKLPKMTTKPLNNSGPKKYHSRKLSMGDLKESRKLSTGDLKESRKLSTGDLKESPREVHGHFECGGKGESESSSGSIELLGLTVILPGGDHGVPNKGKPSSLIERWRLGGSCDCGGWDMGCRLRVIVNETQRNMASTSNLSQSTVGKFQLYSQEQGSERKCIFSLSPFKDGIYSVEFDSSVKLLQAFSICIAVLNGLKPAEFSGLSHFFEKKSTEEGTLTAPDAAKVTNLDLEEIPSSFIACPPGSPVARV